MNKPITLETLERLVDHDKLPLDLAVHYLNIYVSDKVDWKDKIGRRFEMLQKANPNLTKEQLSEKLRSIIAATILIPASYVSVRESIKSRNPEDLLFGIDKFSQFHDKEWFEELKKIVVKDIQIQKFRKEIVSVGIIDEIAYHPWYRQAYNWLIEQAQESGDLTPTNKVQIETSMKNIVIRYGGMAVCNLFTRNKEVVKNVVNWRTGYFIERALFRVYNEEQIKKIKQIELSEAPQRLVKKINAG